MNRLDMVDWVLDRLPHFQQRARLRLWLYDVVSRRKA